MLGSILDGLSEGVLATDATGRPLFANAAAREMLGLGATGLPEEPPDPWRDFPLPEAVARCTGGAGEEEAVVDAGERFLRVAVRSFGEHDGRGGVLVEMRDLSGGDRLEEDRQRFFAGAVHELKTPLSTIAAAAELLATGDDEDPGLRGRLLAHISAEAGRMRQLSQTLLLVARAGRDRRDPEREEVDLGAASWSAAERIEPLARTVGLKLVVEGRGGRVRADREWLEQALLILLSNALKHAGRREGGGEVRLRLDGSAVVVEDDGPGVRPEDRPHVFESFYRGREETGGCGLGLAICRDLVEKMGGTVALEPPDGDGASVGIRLLPAG